MRQHSARCSDKVRRWKRHCGLEHAVRRALRLWHALKCQHLPHLKRERSTALVGIAVVAVALALALAVRRRATPLALRQHVFDNGYAIRSRLQKI